MTNLWNRILDVIKISYKPRPLLSRSFWVVSRKKMSTQKQKIKNLEKTKRSHLVPALMFTICLSGCGAVSSQERLSFPDPHPNAADQIAPCMKEGSELHDWIDRLYKLKDQING